MIRIISRDYIPRPDETTIIVQLRFADDSEEEFGIREVTLFDRGGVEITPIDQPEDYGVSCPLNHYVNTPPLRVSRLPLQAEAYDCGGNLTTRSDFGSIYPFPGDSLDVDPNEIPCMPLRCPDNPSRACELAIERTRTAISEMNGLCIRCDQLEANRDGWRREVELWSALGAFFFPFFGYVVYAGLRSQSFGTRQGIVGMSCPTNAISPKKVLLKLVVNAAVVLGAGS